MIVPLFVGIWGLFHVRPAKSQAVQRKSTTLVIKLFCLAVVGLLSKKLRNENSNAGSDFPIGFIRLPSCETVKNPSYNSIRILEVMRLMMRLKFC